MRRILRKLRARPRAAVYRDKSCSMLPRVMYSPLRWKDKFDTPRAEILPQIEFQFLKVGFAVWWGDSEFWERYLWIEVYNKGDKKKAAETWPWMDMEKNSTWNNKWWGTGHNLLP